MFKDLKPHKDSSSQQLPPPLQQIILKVSLEASRAAKAERTEARRQKRKEIHVAKRKGQIDHRTNRPGKRK